MLCPHELAAGCGNAKLIEYCATAVLRLNHGLDIWLQDLQMQNKLRQGLERFRTRLKKIVDQMLQTST